MCGWYLGERKGCDRLGTTESFVNLSDIENACGMGLQKMTCFLILLALEKYKKSYDKNV